MKKIERKSFGKKSVTLYTHRFSYSTFHVHSPSFNVEPLWNGQRNSDSKERRRIWRSLIINDSVKILLLSQYSSHYLTISLFLVLFMLSFLVSRFCKSFCTYICISPLFCSPYLSLFFNEFSLSIYFEFSLSISNSLSFSVSFYLYKSLIFFLS